MEKTFWRDTAYRQVLQTGDFYSYYGKIEKIAGMTIEATGLTCNIGDICEVSIDDGKKAITEVVGISGKKVFLMPYQNTDGIGYGCTVTNTGEKLRVEISEDLIGRTVDALGKPLDGGPLLRTAHPSPSTASPATRWCALPSANISKWASSASTGC